MANEPDRVHVNISPTYDIARELKNQGYRITDMIGKIVDEPELNVLGILDPRVLKERNLLDKLAGGSEKALYLGTIWVNNPARGADEDNWVVEVYGRENLSIMKELIRKNSPRDVHIEIYLKSEKLRYQ